MKKINWNKRFRLKRIRNVSFFSNLERIEKLVNKIEATGLFKEVYSDYHKHNPNFTAECFPIITISGAIKDPIHYLEHSEKYEPYLKALPMSERLELLKDLKSNN